MRNDQAANCSREHEAQPVPVRWLGTVPYPDAWSAQRAHREQVISGDASGELWMLEHPPTITTGRRAAGVNIEAVQRAGFALFATERGGLATCHEPGQLVGYLIADVRKAGIRCAVSAIEAGIVAWLARLGVDASRREGLIGVWVGGAKIAALGLHVRRGVTMHGFALNLTNTLAGFDLIVPCGIVGGQVTSLARLLPAAPSVTSAWQALGQDVDISLASVGVGCDKP